MARKAKSELNNIHEFTRQLHSTIRSGTRFQNMDNHDERQAKKNSSVCCHDCRGFLDGCCSFIGKYHKTCEFFVWW